MFIIINLLLYGHILYIYSIYFVFGYERERQTLAMKKCHLHKVSVDKLQPTELKELLHHHYRCHHSHRTCVIMCLCVQVCLFHLICLSVLVCFMINDTLLIFKSLWVCVKITIHSFQMSSHLSFSASPSVHRFSVNVEPGTKLERGPASLHLCNNLLVLTRGVPPVVIGHWKLSALRRYGAVPNGFVFEGGTRCGYCK